MAKFLSFLLTKNVFRSTQDGQSQAGHTHDRLDQQFSTIAKLLHSCQVLQTPDDVVDAIDKGLPRKDHHEIFVMRLPGVWSFQHMFEPIGIRMSGIASSAEVATKRCKAASSNEPFTPPKAEPDASNPPCFAIARADQWANPWVQ